MSPLAKRETYWRNLLGIIAELITDPAPGEIDAMRRRLGRRYARKWLEACEEMRND